MTKISMISIILLNLLFTCIQLNAQHMEQPTADTITVVQGDKTYVLPKTIALQAKTINDAYDMGSDQPIPIPPPLLSEVRRINMETISTLMQLFDKHKILSGKALLDAVEQEPANITLNSDLSDYCDYLRFTPGIRLIARHIARKCSSDEVAQLPYSQLKKIAKYYFLLHGHDLSCIDPEKIGFSFNDYKDCRPDHIIPEDSELHLVEFRLKKIHSDGLLGISNLVYLHLDNNKLRTLVPKTFQTLTSLKELYLCFNQLRVLYPKTFQGLRNLLLLNLSHNQLNELDSKTFQGLYTLVILDLSHNQLSEPDPGTFQDLTQLRELYLSHNQLRKLYFKTFQGRSNLVILDLTYNQLSELDPRTFQDLTELRELYLCFNQLRELPLNIFQGPNNLVYIHLGYNQLSELDPETFRGLPKLEKLDLRGNQLSPENIQLVRDSLPHVEILT